MKCEGTWNKVLWLFGFCFVDGVEDGLVWRVVDGLVGVFLSEDDGGLDEEGIVNEKGVDKDVLVNSKGGDDGS